MAQFPSAPLQAAMAAALVPGTTYYLSLHSANPSTTGANEFSGGGYARQAIVFTSANPSVNTLAIAVPNAGSTAATYVGVWTASTSGTYMGSAAMGSSVTAASITFAAGAVSFTTSG